MDLYDRKLLIAGVVIVAIAYARFGDRADKPRPPTPDTPVPVPTPPTPPAPAPAPLTVHDELIAAHNKRRDASYSLQRDDKLMQVAQAWAESMAKNKRMVHQSLSKLGDWRTSGENIAWGQSTVEEVMRVWMASPGHHRNIVYKGYTHIGVGVAKASNGSLYWCVDFGGRDTGEPLPDWGSTQPDFYGETTPAEESEQGQTGQTAPAQDSPAPIPLGVMQ